MAVRSGLPVLVLGAAANRLGLRFNLSPSMAPGVYRVTDGPIQRGATVIVCLPPALSTLAREREYISAGSCADGNAPIGKRVVAIPGDTVDVTLRGMVVNGKMMPNSRPLKADRDGRPLPRVHEGRYILAQRWVWLVSTYSERSFDSRYFGPVSVERVLTRVTPLLALR
jgi:conjugative transfer signal peptidase TraF